jgi:Tfp pilus assembly protein PilN
MIRINLLPGDMRRRPQKKRARITMPSLPDFNGITAFILASWILAPLVGLWLFFSVRGDRQDLQVALEQAVADSARYAGVIATQASLRAQQDTIAQKLELIQHLDAGRYVWPHIMDEVSLALPPFTWLEALDAMGDDARPEFQIQGRTGSLSALTRFMDALEASPFLRRIELISSEQDQLGNDPDEVINNFILTGAYEQPPLDMVETVPLLEAEQPDTGQAGETSDGAPGTS